MKDSDSTETTEIETMNSPDEAPEDTPEKTSESAPGNTTKSVPDNAPKPRDFMSSADLHVMAAELDRRLTGGHIQKIYQRRPRELCFRIHRSDTGSCMLFVHVGRFLCITDSYGELPQSPPPFARFLRKYLGNARILEIRQHEFDRVLEFKLYARGEYRIMLEMFGDGNAVLVN